MNNEYIDFLKNKKIYFDDFGFEIDINKLNPMLFDFQKVLVQWSLKKGRCALFCECGLGKTIMQLEWAKKIIEKEKKSILILAPLAVSLQTKNEGEKFGYEVNIIKNNKVKEQTINITNYEQIDNIDINDYCGIVLDESSILKNFTGVYKTKITDKCAGLSYKLCCTATPSPNDILEIGNHSNFLDIMPANEMISRFFINDTMHFGSYRLKNHSVNDFYEWLSEWSLCVTLPSDVGFPNDGFILPKLNIQNLKLYVDENPMDGQLFNNFIVNATSFSKELKNTKELRLNKVIELVNNSDKQFIIWCKLNDECDYLKIKVKDCREVRGSDKIEVKERNLFDFANAKYRVLITKNKIAQFGMNFQNCNNQIFASYDFSFESLYQSIRRSYRFGQRKEVNIYLISTNTMSNVIKEIEKKQETHVDFQNHLSILMKSNIVNNKKRVLTMDYEKQIKEGKDYKIYYGDCIEETKSIEDNSIGFSIFSPPFSSLYIYSDSIRDMGNNMDDTSFFEQFNFLIPELKRILIPERLIAVHCKNLVNYMNTNGKSGIRDFRGEIIRTFVNNDFSFHSEVTIWKDPVIEMQRTKAHGLLYKQVRKDSSFSRTGLAEYLLLFRKWKDSTNEHLVKPINEKTFDNFPLDIWQKWASPVWMDIQQTNVLNIQLAKDNKDEKHICPLQLDLIERAILLWSNEDDKVFSPFMGIGSEGYIALKLNRRFVGIELKDSYFRQATSNLESMNKIKNQLEF